MPLGSTPIKHCQIGFVWPVCVPPRSEKNKTLPQNLFNLTRFLRYQGANQIKHCHGNSFVWLVVPPVSAPNQILPQNIFFDFTCFFATRERTKPCIAAELIFLPFCSTNNRTKPNIASAPPAITPNQTLPHNLDFYFTLFLCHQRAHPAKHCRRFLLFDLFLRHQGAHQTNLCRRTGFYFICFCATSEHTKPQKFPQISFIWPVSAPPGSAPNQTLPQYWFLFYMFVCH